MHIGRASIHKNTKTGKLLISCVSQTSGPGIVTEPIIRLDASTDSEEVVRQILYVMSCSKTNLPRPKDWNAYLQEYLKQMGVKRHSELYKDTFLVTAITRNDVITFIPSLNKGIKGGFLYLPDAKIEVPANSSIEKISRAFEEALNRCK